MKQVKTLALFMVLIGLAMWIGQAFGGTTGLMVAFVLSLGMSFGSYWYSDKIAIKMAGARPVTPEEEPYLHEICLKLSQQAGKPMPKLYLSDSPQPNAFATGRNPNNAAVCVNRGLAEILDYDEMEGVLAHELSHVYNYDILTGTIAAAMASAIVMLTRFGFMFSSRDRDSSFIGNLLMVILGPIAAMVIRTAITRTRESQADKSGAELCGKPLALANALLKINGQANQLLERRVTTSSEMERDSSFSSLYISMPFNGAFIQNLLRTHPPTEERVASLQAIARDMGVQQ